MCAEVLFQSVFVENMDLGLEQSLRDKIWK